MPSRSKIGRRAFGKTLAATATALVTPETHAQTPPADPQLRSAREELRQSSQEIAKVPLPRTLEPAFRFKP